MGGGRRRTPTKTMTTPCGYVRVMPISATVPVSAVGIVVSGGPVVPARGWGSVISGRSWSVVGVTVRGRGAVVSVRRAVVSVRTSWEAGVPARARGVVVVSARSRVSAIPTSGGVIPARPIDGTSRRGGVRLTRETNPAAWRKAVILVAHWADVSWAGPDGPGMGAECCQRAADSSSDEAEYSRIVVLRPDNRIFRCLLFWPVNPNEIFSAEYGLHLLCRPILHSDSPWAWFGYDRRRKFKDNDVL